jgi:hypothetical protein
MYQDHFRGGRRSVSCLLSNAAGRDLERRIVALEALGHQRSGINQTFFFNILHA